MGIKNMFPIERQEAIVNYVNKNGRIRISDIQNMFLVGYETAKNDLILLEKEKKLRRVHGGAISISSTENCNLNYSFNSNLNNFLRSCKTELNIYIDSSIFFNLSPEFFLTNNKFFTNSISIAQTIISMGKEVKMTGTDYSTCGISKKFLINDVIDVGLVSLAFDNEKKLFWIRSLEETYYNELFSSCKKIVIVRNVNTVYKEDDERRYLDLCLFRKKILFIE